MKFYHIKFTLDANGKTVKDASGNVTLNEFETHLHETEQECMNEAHDYCMNFCKNYKKNFGVEVQYNWEEVTEVK